TENIQVKFSDLTSDKYNDERYDLSGDITITFEHSSIQNTIVLDISEGHSTIDMQPTIMKFKDDRVEKMNEIAGICNNGSTFVENLFSAYMGYEIRKIDTPEKSEEFMKSQVRKTIENGFADINRLLLVKKISSLEYKACLVSCPIVYTMNQKISQKNPLVRFTSNIIGSTELDNPDIQMKMLPSIVFMDLHNKKSSNLNYPNIKISEKRYVYLVSILSSSLFINYILDCDISIFITWFKFYIDNFYTKHGLFFNPLLDGLVNRKIFHYIFKDGTMKYANKIDNIIIQKHDRKEDETLSIIHFMWVIYLCVEETPNLELIKANLDVIREIEVLSCDFGSNIETQDIFDQAIQTLSGLKNQLCKDENDISRFNSIMKALENV
ncbi:hypothetical protein NEAUS03_0276, partial [Nematocida ausubeli]